MGSHPRGGEFKEQVAKGLHEAETSVKRGKTDRTRWDLGGAGRVQADRVGLWLGIELGELHTGSHSLFLFCYYYRLSALAPFKSPFLWITVVLFPLEALP